MRPVRRWITVVTGAEALGFATAAGIAISVTVGGMEGAGGVALVIAGGAAEGALLGAGQWIGMSGSRPPAARWILATSAGAAIAWSLGILPSTLGLSFSNPGTIVAVAVGGVLLIATIPVLQWLALRRSRTLRWIPVNMGAWAVAIVWTLAPSPFIDEQSPTWVIAVLYVVAGMLMALTIAALTARTATRLFPLATRTRSAGEVGSPPTAASYSQRRHLKIR